MSIATAITGFADEISPDLDEQLALLKRLDFDGLDLRTAFGKNVLAMSDQEVDEVKRRTEDSGLRVHAIGSPVNKVPLRAQNEAEELMKLHRAIEVAQRCGTKRIRVFTPESDDWDATRDWMAAHVELARGAEVVLLHENDGHFFGARPENAKKLFAEFGGENFKAAFDFANTVLIGYRPMADWFPWLLPYLDTLHIKDAVEADKRVVPAGEGDAGLVKTLKWLKAQGWKGVFTLEPHLATAGPMGGFSGAQLFEKAANAMRRVMAEAEL